MTDLRVGAATDVGLVRANNQDAWLVDSPLFAVADGMGGHAAGEVASAAAVASLKQSWRAASTLSGEALAEAGRAANRAVWDQAVGQPDLRGMGTTLVAVALVPGGDGGHDQVAVINVGDSRVYLMRAGELRQITQDHSLVAELVAEGQLAEEEAEFHPQRHVLTRALGVDPEVAVDLDIMAPEPGDRFLLCSDGLSREVSDHQIASVLRRLVDPDEAARELVSEARMRGGSDNITVVLVDVVGADVAADSGADTVLSPAVLTADDGTGATTAIEEPEGDYPAPVAPSEADVAPSEADVASKDATAVVAAVAATGTEAGAPSAEDAAGTGATAKVTVRQRRIAERARRARERQAAENVPKARLFTVRTVGFVLALLAVVVLAGAGIGWYARAGYYVGLQGNQLTIFKGRPGGLLWFEPTVARPTGVSTEQVETRHLPELRAGKTEDSFAAAVQYVDNVKAEYIQAQAGGGSPATIGPVTTLPGATSPSGAPTRSLPSFTMTPATNSGGATPAATTVGTLGQ